MVSKKKVGRISTSRRDNPQFYIQCGWFYVIPQTDLEHLLVSWIASAGFH